MKNNSIFSHLFGGYNVQRLTVWKRKTYGKQNVVLLRYWIEMQDVDIRIYTEKAVNEG